MIYKQAVIVKIPGGREMEYVMGQDDNFKRLFETATETIRNRTAEIVWRGEFELEAQRELFTNKKGLATFIFFPFMFGGNLDDIDNVWQRLDDYMKLANYPVLIDKTYLYQIIELQFIDPSIF